MMNKVYLSISSKCLNTNQQYGVSAYAYVIDFIEQSEKAKYRHSAAFYFSTEMRIELLGIINALELLEPSNVYLYTKNSMIVSAINRIQQLGLISQKQEINRDLWNKIIALLDKHSVICIQKETSMALSDCKKEVKSVIKFPEYNDLDGMTIDELKNCLEQLQQENSRLEQQLVDIESKKVILLSTIKILSEFERNYHYT